MKNKNLENQIKDYLLDEGILREKLKSSEVDFGFIISYPPGPRSQKMSIFKPKNKNSIFLTVKIQISEKHAKIIRSFDDNKKFQLFNDIRRYFLIKEVYFKINTQNLIYEIHEQIYPGKEEYVSKDILFKRILKVFYCFVFTNLLIEEYCLGKDISSTKFDSKFDLSLYS